MTVYAQTFMTVFARHCGKGKQYCNDREAGGGGGGALGAGGLFRKKGKRSASRHIYIQLAVTEDVAQWTLALSENTTAIVLQVEP